MFAVCLTFYIIVVVINKEENLQHFLRVHLDKMCPQIWFAVDAQGRMCSVDLLPENTLTPSRVAWQLWVLTMRSPRRAGLAFPFSDAGRGLSTFLSYPFFSFLSF